MLSCKRRRETTTKSCEQFQAQLLEHLYGLLEAEESLALIEHAGQCEVCRTALLQADSQRLLFAAAALTQSPNIRFDALTSAMLVPS